jgi:hypothetical protein
MRLPDWLRRRRRVEMASELTDPEWVMVELLASLSKNALRAVLWEFLAASRDPKPPSDIARVRGQRLLGFLREAGDSRPELLVHFGTVTQLLVAWADNNERLMAQGPL